MSDAALLTLSQWLSPAFPISGYAYSHGLETAISRGDVKTPESLAAWLTAIIETGSGKADAVLLVQAMASKADHGALQDCAAALSASRERWEETMAQGRAFTDTVNQLTGADAVPVALPIAVGRAAADLDLSPVRVAALYLQAFAGNLVSAAVRFVPLGQTEGQVVLAKLQPAILRTADAACHLSTDDIMSSVPGADLAAMEHETLDVRIFRS